MTKLKVAAIVSTVALALSLGIAQCWPQLQKALPQKEQPDPTLVEMPPPAKEREDHQLFYVGYNLFVRGKLDDAEAVFHRSLGINPKSADAHYGLAFSANHRGYKHKALDEYNRAIDLNPRLADAYNDRGNLYMSMHNTDAALRDYSIAMLICPWNAANYEDRAETYLERKEYLKVIADATRAIDRDPKLTRAFQYRAAAWQALGKNAQALADLDIACKNEKETNFALSARAKLKTSMKDIKGAINDYGLAL
ncbi:MAG: tetratricopeptide repeat protein, partial [Candidatus Melainabacteria bacterium]|nr:tetratricopeptide repeat protein [Candidatus Melainabacteria bacterium]